MAALASWEAWEAVPSDDDDDEEGSNTDDDDDDDDKGEASPPCCPGDDWSVSPRNCFSEDYDMDEKNRGLRLQLMGDGFLSIVNAIIRPPRCLYTLRDLGPTINFRLSRRSPVTVSRKDFALEHDVHTARGTLHLSEWTPDDFADYHSGGGGGGGGNPTTSPAVVVYTHGNAGSRLDVVNNGILEAVASRGFSLIAFDCAGSGMSQGSEYVSLGHFEQLDLQLVLRWLRRRDKGGGGGGGGRRNVALWGFSQGGAASLFCVGRKKKNDGDGGGGDGGGDDDDDDNNASEASVAGLVVDGAFASFKTLAKQHPMAQHIKGGPLALQVLYPFVRMRVKARSGLDVNDHLDVVASCKRAPADLPCFFVAAACDELVPATHGEAIFAAYRGEPKRRVLLEGPQHDHSSPRPRETLEEAMNFLEPLLRPGVSRDAAQALREKNIEDAAWGPSGNAAAAAKPLPKRP